MPRKKATKAKTSASAKKTSVKKSAPKKATRKKTSVKKADAVVVDKKSESVGITENLELTATEQKRQDWELNQMLIQEAFIKLLKKKKRKPTAVELAEATGLSTRTIDRHVRQMKFEMQHDTWRTLTPTVIHAIHKGAVRGGVFAQKLWLQVVENWSEDINLNHGAQETLADVIAATRGIKLRKDIERNARKRK